MGSQAWYIQAFSLPEQSMGSQEWGVQAFPLQNNLWGPIFGFAAFLPEQYKHRASFLLEETPGYSILWGALVSEILYYLWGGGD